MAISIIKRSSRTRLDSDDTKNDGLLGAWIGFVERVQHAVRSCLPDVQPLIAQLSNLMHKVLPSKREKGKPKAPDLDDHNESGSIAQDRLLLSAVLHALIEWKHFMPSAFIESGVDIEKIIPSFFPDMHPLHQTQFLELLLIHYNHNVSSISNNRTVGHSALELSSFYSTHTHSVGPATLPVLNALLSSCNDDISALSRAWLIQRVAATGIFSMNKWNDPSEAVIWLDMLEMISTASQHQDIDCSDPGTKRKKKRRHGAEDHEDGEKDPGGGLYHHEQSGSATAVASFFVDAMAMTLRRPADFAQYTVVSQDGRNSDAPVNSTGETTPVNRGSFLALCCLRQALRVVVSPKRKEEEKRSIAVYVALSIAHIAVLCDDGNDAQTLFASGLMGLLQEESARIVQQQPVGPEAADQMNSRALKRKKGERNRVEGEADSLHALHEMLHGLESRTGHPLKLLVGWITSVSENDEHAVSYEMARDDDDAQLKKRKRSKMAANTNGNANIDKKGTLHNRLSLVLLKDLLQDAFSSPSIADITHALIPEYTRMAIQFSAEDEEEHVAETSSASAVALRQPNSINSAPIAGLEIGDAYRSSILLQYTLAVLRKTTEQCQVDTLYAVLQRVVEKNVQHRSASSPSERGMWGYPRYSDIIHSYLSAYFWNIPSRSEREGELCSKLVLWMLTAQQSTTNTAATSSAPWRALLSTILHCIVERLTAAPAPSSTIDTCLLELLNNVEFCACIVRCNELAGTKTLNPNETEAAIPVALLSALEGIQRAVLDTLSSLITFLGETNTKRKSKKKEIILDLHRVKLTVATVRILLMRHYSLYGSPSAGRGTTAELLRFACRALVGMLSFRDKEGLLQEEKQDNGQSHHMLDAFIDMMFHVLLVPNENRKKCIGEWSRDACEVLMLLEKETLAKDDKSPAFLVFKACTACPSHVRSMAASSILKHSQAARAVFPGVFADAILDAEASSTDMLHRRRSLAYLLPLVDAYFSRCLIKSNGNGVRGDGDDGQCVSMGEDYGVDGGCNMVCSALKKPLIAFLTAKSSITEQPQHQNNDPWAAALLHEHILACFSFLLKNTTPCGIHNDRRFLTKLLPSRTGWSLSTVTPTALTALAPTISEKAKAACLLLQHYRAHHLKSDDELTISYVLPYVATVCCTLIACFKSTPSRSSTIDNSSTGSGAAGCDSVELALGEALDGAVGDALAALSLEERKKKDFTDLATLLCEDFAPAVLKYRFDDVHAVRAVRRILAAVLPKPDSDVQSPNSLEQSMQSISSDDSMMSGIDSCINPPVANCAIELFLKVVSHSRFLPSLRSPLASPVPLSPAASALPFPLQSVLPLAGTETMHDPSQDQALPILPQPQQQQHDEHTAKIKRELCQILETLLDLESTYSINISRSAQKSTKERQETLWKAEEALLPAVMACYGGSLSAVDRSAWGLARVLNGRAWKRKLHDTGDGDIEHNNDAKDEFEALLHGPLASST